VSGNTSTRSKDFNAETYVRWAFGIKEIKR